LGEHDEKLLGLSLLLDAFEDVWLGSSLSNSRCTTWIKTFSRCS